jgi:hypothetical protein
VRYTSAVSVPAVLTRAQEHDSYRWSIYRVRPSDPATVPNCEWPVATTGRNTLAAICHRVADWLRSRTRYMQESKSASDLSLFHRIRPADSWLHAAIHAA